MTQLDSLESGESGRTNRTAHSVRGGRMVKTSRGIVSFAPALVAGGMIFLSGTASANAETCTPHTGEPEGYELCDLGLLPQTEFDEYAYSQSFGVSGDGSVVAGAASDYYSRATRWTSQGGFENLGVLAGDDRSFAFGTSVDGLVLVGYSNNGAGKSTPFRWTRDSGMTALNTDPNYKETEAVDANFDGTVIVGNASSPLPGLGLRAIAVRWENGEYEALGALGSFNISEATAVDNSGQRVVGFATNGGTGATDAFRWNPTDGMMSLGITDYTNSKAYGISADGSIIVGDMVVGLGGRTAFRWTSEGAVPLARLQGYIASSAFAISGDGKVIVGRSDDGQFYPDASTAVLWKESGEVVSLGRLTASNTSEARAVNSDGTVVVGFSNVLETSITAYEWYNPRAFIWRAAGGGNGIIQDYTNLMASFPVLANDTDLAVSTQQWSLGKVLDQTAFVGVEGRNYFAASAGASNAGSGALSDSQSNQVAGLTFGRGISAELTVGASLQMSGARNAASGFDADTGTSISVFAEYSKGGADRTGLQASLALGYAAAGNTITRGQGFTDVEAATGNGDLETMAARVSIGYGIDHVSGWLLTPHAAISQYSTSRGAYAEDPTATAFSAAYDELNVETTVGTAGIVAEQKLNDASSFSLGAGVDFDINADDTVLAGSANIPGMEEFGVTSTLVRNDVRPYVTIDYSIDVSSGGTVTASARLEKALYGNDTDVGVGVRYGINF